MFCENCGAELPEDARFCENCGAKVDYEEENSAEGYALPEGAKAGDIPEIMHKGKYVTKNVVLCPDGKYRWTYAFHMLKNPTILFTVWKVLWVSFGILYVFFLLLSIGQRDALKTIFGFTKTMLILMAVFMVIGFFAYLIVAGQYGWKYMVLFEMDEGGVVHRQMKSQFDKARASAWLTAAAGLATGSLTTAAIGLNAATHSSTSSEFSFVKSVKAVKRRSTIYVNELLTKNQLYADGEDFDFILEYVLAHVPEKTRVKK